MSLSSVFSTAISGLQASETIIDVAGNNVANANTVGFKSSEAVFATQFVQTLSLGSAPSTDSGGSNPMQTGLGTQVSAITPDFSQGTLQISSNPSDLAIQGNGFFVVQSSSGGNFYTRNGSFHLNSNNQLTNSNGQLVMGYGVDNNFQVQATTLQSLSIPIGSTAVARATQNVTMEGTLSATGTVATSGQIIQSQVLGDGSLSAPASGEGIALADTPDKSVITTATSNAAGAGMTSSAQYQYEFVYVDANGTTESTPSGALSVTTSATDNEVTLSNLPTSANYPQLRIYRTDAGGSAFKLLTTIPNPAGSFTDTTSDATLDASNGGNPQTLNTTTLTGNYSYYVTFSDVAAGNDDPNGNPVAGNESRPEAVPIGSLNIVNGRIQLTNLPTPQSGTNWKSLRIYRNTATDPTDFHMVSEVPYDPANPTQNTTFTDSVSDAVLLGTATGMTAARKSIDMNGPKAQQTTLLTNVLSTDNTGSHNLFQLGTLTLTASKGGRTLDPKTFQVTATSTLQELVAFMQQATGIHTPNPTNQIPNDGSGQPAGGTITNNGQIQLISNNGTDSAVDIDLSALQLTTANGTQQVNLNFATTQQAVGSGAVSDFVVYDSLGVAVNVRVTAELQSQNSTQTVYRWYADSPDNQPSNGVDIGAGSGLLAFDGQGKLISATDTTVAVARSASPATSPLDFKLDFSGISGLAAASSSLAATSQDGFPPGKLTSYNIADDGTIKGVFDNGTQRDLGQIELARFANPGGLVQEGQNLFSAGVNSGLPVLGTPNSEGMGSIVSGAVELSNTDISKSLIELITASTMYRGNAQVISAANQLLQDLLNLGR